MRRQIGLWILAASGIGQPATGRPQVEPAPSPIAWTSFTGKAFDGSPLPGEVGRIEVPENRTRPDGRRIELAFVRYRTTHPNPGPPIFFLVGGPGASGTEFCGAFATHPQVRLLEHADVIGIDQRGTGLTRPNLMEPQFLEKLPEDRAFGRSDVIRAFASAAAECARYWTERGVDLEAYNTVESADDVDDVRCALGAEKIVIIGSSYGSHLGLAYLRRHAEHVERAALMKVEGPDDTWKLPSALQRQLEGLGAQVAADPGMRSDLPDLLDAVRSLLERLRAEPVAVTLNSDSADQAVVVIGPYDLQVALAQALPTTDGIAGLPRVIHACIHGDWSAIVETSLANRRVSIEAMPLMMDCASGGSAERIAQIERERSDLNNLLSDAIMAPMYPSGCEACGSPDLGDGFRAFFECDTPVLFVSGTLDARTPPENVEAIRGGFSRHAHILVRNAAHDGRELMSEEYRDLLQMFLRGEAVESCVIALPPVIFESLDR